MRFASAWYGYNIYKEPLDKYAIQTHRIQLIGSGRKSPNSNCVHIAEFAPVSLCYYYDPSIYFYILSSIPSVHFYLNILFLALAFFLSIGRLLFSIDTKKKEPFCLYNFFSHTCAVRVSRIYCNVET